MAREKKMKDENDNNKYLSDELLINIFTRLPPNILHDSVRLVCKHWARVIRDPHFIETHLRKTKSGLFIYAEESTIRSHFLEFNGQDFTVRDVRRWFPSQILGSCNGIALFNDSNHPHLFWVGNPITMQMTPLPYLQNPTHWVNHITQVSRIPSTGECKVVDVYEDDDTFYFFVLTVGVDQKWRKLEYEHMFVNRHGDRDNRVFSVGGVVYWLYYDFEMNGSKHFLAMDIADETLNYVPVPSECLPTCVYLEMGDYLSEFSCKSSKFEVRVLNDWRRGEWSKLYDIDIQIIECIYDDRLWPFAWLNDDEVVMFKFTPIKTSLLLSSLAYNVKKEETKIVDLGRCGRFICVSHINGLVSW